jgi:hypothetical protein
MRLTWWLLIAEWDGKRRPGAPRPGVRIILLMPTLEQAKKVHRTEMMAELEGDWKFLGGVVNRSEWRVTFPGGSWIQWVTAERAKSIRGIRCDYVCLDEADCIDLETLQAVVLPWMSEPHSLAMTLIAGTPERGRFGLLYDRFRKGQDGAQDHFSYHATYKDSGGYADAERIEKQRPFIEPALFAREYLCDFDAAEGLVYPMFDEDFHVRKPRPDQVWNEILVGVDHGYEDPGVFLIVGVAGSGNEAVCHVLEEVYEQHKTESWWVDQCRATKTKYQRYPTRWYADPSQPARIEAFRRQASVRIEGAQNAIEDGVSCVADKMFVRRVEGRDPYAKFYVDPSCKNYIRELGLYRRKRDPRNRERVLDDIQDKDNHANDAARYLCFSRFGKPTSSRIELA